MIGIFAIFLVDFTCIGKRVLNKRVTKMGKLSVSMNINWDMEMNEYVSVFKDMKVDRIFMAFLDRGPFKSCERRTNNIKTYIEKRKFFEENGFETALWISTLGYGGAVTEYNKGLRKTL